jgi:hypothetical protein
MEGGMPRYFFDIDDGERSSRDSVGTELADREAVRREATGILPDVAREELPDGNERIFACSVRDESGKVIFVAKLTLKAVRATEPRPPPCLRRPPPCLSRRPADPQAGTLCAPARGLPAGAARPALAGP